MKISDLRLVTELILSLVFMSGVPVLIKFISANPVTIGFVRLIMASFLMGIVLIIRKERIPFQFKYLKPLMLIGIIFSIHWITYFYSIKISTASIGILGASTYGIHLIFLGWIFLNTRPRIIDGIAVLMAIAGAYIIIPEFSFKNNITSGLLLSILSGFFFAILPILHQKNQHISNTVRSMGQYIFAIPLFLILFKDINLEFSQNEWFALLYLGIFGTFLAHFFWIKVTTILPTTLTSVLFYVVIPLTMLLSYVYLDEEMNLQKIAGASIIISANLLGIFGRIKKGVKTPDLD